MRFLISKKLLPSLMVMSLALSLPAASSYAQTVSAMETGCDAMDTACLLQLLEEDAGNIDDTRWKDQTYRELAKLLTRHGDYDHAIALIQSIEHPDTKAMTIRGIGMEAARKDLPATFYTALFNDLHEAAHTIEHAPSHAIALTYIAMAQAFAGDNDGAMATAATMENAALRNKAYAETSEIQAERGDIDAALASIAAIDNDAFRDKALRMAAQIFSDQVQYDYALQSVSAIKNHYQRSQALLYMVDSQILPEPDKSDVK